MEIVSSFLPDISLWGSRSWFVLITLAYLVLSFVSSNIKMYSFGLITSIAYFLVLDIWSDSSITFLTVSNVVTYILIGFIYSASSVILWGRRHALESIDFIYAKDESLSDTFEEGYVLSNVLTWIILWPHCILNKVIGVLTSIRFMKVHLMKLVDRLYRIGYKSGIR